MGRKRIMGFLNLDIDISLKICCNILRVDKQKLHFLEKIIAFAIILIISLTELVLRLDFRYSIV